jgi:hypothetical protein
MASARRSRLLLKREASVSTGHDHPGLRRRILGDLVDVARRGQPAADVEELPDPGLGGQVADRPAQEVSKAGRYPGRPAAPAASRSAAAPRTARAAASACYSRPSAPPGCLQRRGQAAIGHRLAHRAGAGSWQRWPRQPTASSSPTPCSTSSPRPPPCTTCAAYSSRPAWPSGLPRTGSATSWGSGPGSTATARAPSSGSGCCRRSRTAASATS